jgi:hypothetical protein
MGEITLQLLARLLAVEAKDLNVLMFMHTLLVKTALHSIKETVFPFETSSRHKHKQVNKQQRKLFV